MKKWRLFGVVGLLVLASPLGAGNLNLQTIMLFNGSNTSAAVDTVEQVSPWIDVRGAQRIILRSWTTKTAFAVSEADSDYVDSIAVFKVAFSDSVSGYVVASNNQTYPVAADSVVITTTALATVDTVTKMVGVWHPPLQEALRAPGNGSGVMTIVMPVSVGLATADNNGFVYPQYMRVYYTPIRRNTPNGGQSTSGERARGLKGFRMQAIIVKGNK